MLKFKAISFLVSIFFWYHMLAAFAILKIKEIYVCICVRERNKQREGGKDKKKYSETTNVGGSKMCLDSFLAMLFLTAYVSSHLYQ